MRPKRALLSSSALCRFWPPPRAPSCGRAWRDGGSSARRLAERRAEAASLPARPVPACFRRYRRTRKSGS